MIATNTVERLIECPDSPLFFSINSAERNADIESRDDVHSVWPVNATVGVGQEGQWTQGFYYPRVCRVLEVGQPYRQKVCHSSLGELPTDPIDVDMIIFSLLLRVFLG